MRFTKMEGLGNDYLYLDCMEGEPPDLPGLAVRLSDRHFGVGADGLICVKPGRTGDFSMEMYNADGSRGSMCGNGIRCLAKYVCDRGLTKKRCLTIDTDAGPRRLEVSGPGGRETQVAVDMGEAALSPPVALTVEGREMRAVPVWVGNPHAVLFCPEVEEVDLARLGPRLEHHPGLRERSNIEFAAAAGRDCLRVRVWERGSGITLACGTGACAVFAAARREGLCGAEAEVRLPGGSLHLAMMGERIRMTGPACTVFEGEILL